MKTENRYFEIIPKVILANTTVEVTIRPLIDHVSFKDETEYEISYYPLERFSTIGEYVEQEKLLIKPQEGILKFNQFFKGEQEHNVTIRDIETDKSVTLKVYSVEKDLFERRPYKGDLHMHTTCSDGRESPNFVTASCRKIGLDFMAITDHGKYYPSIEAQEAFKALDVDMLIARGEEVHSENNNVHIVNYGGSFSVNELVNENREKYYKEVKEIEDKITDIGDDQARFDCASSMWCFDRIREGNGLAIFCHPYWLRDHGYYISDTVTSFMYKHQPYDAVEVIGGYSKEEEESNALQIARYYEERQKGKKIPIVGVTDSHGCVNRKLFNWYYTIVFSPSNEQQDLIQSIKDLYSIGVEQMPNEGVNPVGPFRLVKYSLFLIREVFPAHDELCYDEGQLMIRYITGDQSSREKLHSLKGQVNDLYNKYWA